MKTLKRVGQFSLQALVATTSLPGLMAGLIASPAGAGDLVDLAAFRKGLQVDKCEVIFAGSAPTAKTASIHMLKALSKSPALVPKPKAEASSTQPARQWSTIEVRPEHGGEAVVKTDFLNGSNDFLHMFNSYGVLIDNSLELKTHMSLSADRRFIAIAREHDIDAAPSYAQTWSPGGTNGGFYTLLIYDPKGVVVHKIKIPAVVDRSTISMVQFIPGQDNVYVDGDGGHVGDVYSASTGLKMNDTKVPHIVSFTDDGRYALQQIKHAVGSGRGGDVTFNVYAVSPNGSFSKEPIATYDLNRLFKVNVEEFMGARILSRDRYLVTVKRKNDAGVVSIEVQTYSGSMLEQTSIVGPPIPAIEVPFSSTADGKFFASGNEKARPGGGPFEFGEHPAHLYVHSQSGELVSTIDYKPLFPDHQTIHVRDLKIVGKQGLSRVEASGHRTDSFDGYVQAYLVVLDNPNHKGGGLAIREPGDEQSMSHWSVTWHVRNGVAKLVNSHEIADGAVVLNSLYHP